MKPWLDATSLTQLTTEVKADPLVPQNRLARHVLEESVANGVVRHDGPVELRTSPARD